MQATTAPILPHYKCVSDVLLKTRSGCNQSNATYILPKLYHSSLIILDSSVNHPFSGTAQLQGNICTHPKHVLHAFQTCLHLVKKGRSTNMCLAAALSKVWMRLVCVSDVFCLCFRRISYSSQMCLNVTLELSCTVHCKHF